MASEHDRAILNSIFNPLLPIGECIFDEESLPRGLKDEEIDSDEAAHVKEMEFEGVQAAEIGNLDKAVEMFTAAISLMPDRPSCYNNRAQAFRLQGKIKEALIDLNNTINLSEGQGRSACQAFCQRGLIFRREGRDEEARADFEAAAILGSEFAKAQMIQMNPYAAMCNKMLHEVIGKLQRGESEGIAE